MIGESALLFTISVDATVFICALFVFLAIREERGDHRKSAPLMGGGCKGYDVEEDEVSMAHLWSVPMSELRNSDAKMYLKFIHTLAIFFSVLCVLGLLVLLPVNVSGSRFSSVLDMCSLENIAPGDAKLWVACVLTCVFAILGYISLFGFRSGLLADMGATRGGVERCAVLIKNIDKSMLQSSALYGYFHRRFPGSVVEAHIAADFRELEEAQHKLDAARLVLERSRGDLSGKRQPSWWMFGRSEAALEEQVTFYDRMTSRIRARGPSRGTGVGFVLFRHPEVVEEAIGPCAYGWVAERAPVPTDVEWGNLSYVSSSSREWFASMVWTSCLFVLTLAVISPVAFIFKLRPFVNDVTHSLQNDTFRAMVLQYWPPLVVFLVNSVLTPACIFFVATRQRHANKSAREYAILTMNAFFLMLNTFLVPLMSLQSIPRFVERFVSMPVGDWNTTLGTMFLSSSGGFAIQYMASTVFLSNGSQLVQMPRTLGMREKDAPFDFGYWYASALSVLTLCLGFSVVVPLILPWAALYFWVKFYVDKYNFLFLVTPPGLDSSGRLAHAMLPYWCFSIALFEFCMSGFFVVQGGHFAIAGAALCCVSLGTIAMGLAIGPQADTFTSQKGYCKGASAPAGSYRHPLARGPAV